MRGGAACTPPSPTGPDCPAGRRRARRTVSSARAARSHSCWRPEPSGSPSSCPPAPWTRWSSCSRWSAESEAWSPGTPLWAHLTNSWRKESQQTDSVNQLITMTVHMYIFILRNTVLKGQFTQMTQNRFSYLSLFRCLRYLSAPVTAVLSLKEKLLLSFYNVSFLHREHFPLTCAQTWKWSCRWGRWRCRGGARPAMRWCAATGWARPVGRCKWQDVGL